MKQIKRQVVKEERVYVSNDGTEYMFPGPARENDITKMEKKLGCITEDIEILGKPFRVKNVYVKDEPAARLMNEYMDTAGITGEKAEPMTEYVLYEDGNHFTAVRRDDLLESIASALSVLS